MNSTNNTVVYYNNCNIYCDCIGCPYFVDFGSGDRICTAPNGCRLYSTDDDYFNGNARPSDVGGFDIDGIISGLLED